VTTRPESGAPMPKCDALLRAEARTASEASVALPSLFNTTSNILHPRSQESETIYADDAPIHRLRSAVAAVVAELGWDGRTFGLALSNLRRIWILIESADAAD
jgi:hypothetical protein